MTKLQIIVFDLKIEGEWKIWLWRGSKESNNSWKNLAGISRHDGKIGCDAVEMQWWDGWVEYWPPTGHRPPVAQLVDYPAVTREVVSSTPARPLLGVFK